MIIGAGCDPGKGACAFAVVGYDPLATAGTRATLMFAGSAYGRYPDLWRERMLEAIEEIAEIGPNVFAVEEMPRAQRSSKPVDRTVPSLIAGRVIEAYVSKTGVEPVMIQPSEWWSAVGVRKKRGDCRHRIKEASTRVVGATNELLKTPKTRQVDVAEAILIAYAACLVPPTPTPRSPRAT